MGDKDKLLPPKKTNQQIILKEGQHFMIVDRANEVTNLIRQELKHFG